METAIVQPQIVLIPKESAIDQRVFTATDTKTAKGEIENLLFQFSSWFHSPAGSTPWVSTSIEHERLHFLIVCVKQQARNESIRETRVHAINWTPCHR